MTDYQHILRRPFLVFKRRLARGKTCRKPRGILRFQGDIDVFSPAFLSRRSYHLLELELPLIDSETRLCLEILENDYRAVSIPSSSVVLCLEDPFNDCSSCRTTTTIPSSQQGPLAAR